METDHINTLGYEQKGWNFSDDIFKSILFSEIFSLLMKNEWVKWLLQYTIFLVPF